MTENEIFNKVQEIFRDVFDDEDMIIENSTNSDVVEEWDSLNHINLVSAIEKEFKIKFTLPELMELKDVGEMNELILKKTNEN